ncbi:hypothetical protein K1719_029697 [Acacia pycnantha]|nr:hypothetical protein K1719_029697 [Acacia pycnantha]
MLCLLFLAETKSETVDRLSCVSKLGFDDMSYVPSLGRSGGILTAWRSAVIEVEILQLDRQMIHLRCRFPRENWFYITALYAIPDNAHKQILWNQLNGLASSMVMSWAVIGDFNDVASLDKRTGGGLVVVRRDAPYSPIGYSLAISWILVQLVPSSRGGVRSSVMVGVFLSV